MRKRKIYIAAPLFNEGERAFNERIDAILRDCGHETFLPQREGGCVADLPETIEGVPKRKYLFKLDCSHIINQLVQISLFSFFFGYGILSTRAK